MDARGSMDAREKLRKECHADLEIIRSGGELPERAYHLMERLVERLDRLETGSFDATEAPTAPAVPHPTSHPAAHPSKAAWSNAAVLEALETGKKPKDE